MPNTTNAPGKHYRKGLTFKRAAAFFSDEDKAEEWFIASRWADGIRCPFCDSPHVTERKRKGTGLRRWYCTGKSCKKTFSVKTKTAMHDSKISLGDWGLAYYLYLTNLKGVSSMKLHRDLGVTQKTAWYMGHRIRASLMSRGDIFAGPAEADETFVGGERDRMHKWQRDQLKGRGTVGKAIIAGIKDRETGRVEVQVIPDQSALTLQGFVIRNTEPDAVVYTDDALGYKGINRKHGSVKHSVGEFVNGQITTNGIESFWSMLKRGYKGTYHKMSFKHLQRYADEFAGRHNVREMDTIDQMSLAVQEAEGKRLSYKELIGKTDKSASPS